MDELLETITTAETMHDTFRVWITTEPHNLFSITLLQVTLKQSFYVRWYDILLNVFLNFLICKIIERLFLTFSVLSSLPMIHPRECVLAWNEHLQEFHRTSWKSATCQCGSLYCTVWPFSTLLCRYCPFQIHRWDRGAYLLEPIKKFYRLDVICNSVFYWFFF